MSQQNRNNYATRRGANSVLYKHGGSLNHAPTPEYIAWLAMNQRCYYRRSKAYKNYGGRGITVCDEWRGEGGFERFLAHVGPKPSPEHSLDRFPNNNGNYEPGNVRWATRIEQSQNRRKREPEAVCRGPEHHPLAPDNLLIESRGRRCRACRDKRLIKTKRQKKAA